MNSQKNVNSLNELLDQEEEDEEEEPPKWYEEFKDDPPALDKFEENLINYLKLEAQKVLDDETKYYNSRIKMRNPDQKWLQTALTKGTVKDKIAALIVSVQNSPIHNLHHVVTLVNMVKVGKKNQCIAAMESLSELFVGDLLKGNQKLRTFDRQPLHKLEGLCEGNASLRRKRLAAWVFEEKLKELYALFIKELDFVAKDTLDMNREKAIVTMNFLLSSNPEKENILLSNIINKIGDPSTKVASKVVYCLTQLLRAHPNMKQVVLNEVERLLFRPHIAGRAQFYCICFLSQFVYRNEDKEIARNAINIYFSFFKALTKKGEVDSRLMGALLMGVKRAYPFANFEKGEASVMADHIDTLYKIVHISNFNISLHTLCLLHQATSSADDRFYSALYKKLLDKQLGVSTYHAMLINLLYKSILNDENTSRVIAFIKRLLQISLGLPVPIVCAFLYMLSHIVCKRKTVQAFEIKAQKSMNKFSGIEDEEEKYYDADDNVNENPNPQSESSNLIKTEEKKTVIGWYHCVFSAPPKTANNIYDPWKRNPAFANAETSAYIELATLTKHFHPTVSLFAQQIMNNELIHYSGDPLCDFTLVKFLERFVFKNPKKIKEDMDERGPDPILAQRKYYHPNGVKGISITSTDYLKIKEENIPVDELFLYRYLKDKYGERGYSIQKEKNEDEEDDIESVASEEFEEMLENMIGKKNKELNFMEDIGENLIHTKSRNKKDEVEEEESGESEDDEEGLSDLSEVDENEEIMEFSGEDGEVPEDLDIDEVLNEELWQQKKSSMKDTERIKKKRKSNGDLDGLFAPAEEFSELLDQAGNDGMKPGMAHTLFNKDNAAQKQLKWEASRNRWLKGVGEFKKRKSNLKYTHSKKRLKKR